MQIKNTLNTKKIISESIIDKDITCSIYNSFEDVSEFKNEWDSFIESVEGDIFLSFDWCKIWWQFYGEGRLLQIFIFFKEKKIIGIIPMFFEKLKLLFISIKIGKIISSDFTLSQFSIPIHPDFLDSCVSSFLILLKEREKDWDAIILGPLSGLSTNIESLNQSLCKYSNKFIAVKIEENMVQTYFNLESTLEKHLASLKKSQRRLIQRKYSAIKKIDHNNFSNVEVILADKNNFNSLFNDFVQLHQSHWNRLGKLGHFGDWPSSYSFHHEMATSHLKNGRLRLICVKHNNQIIGFEYAYKFGNRYYAILNARTENDFYSKIGIGPILFFEQVKMAISENVATIDAMRGKYDYKLMLGGKMAIMKKIIFFRKNFVNNIRISFYHLIVKLLDFFYYRLWFSRLAPNLFFPKKPLWKLWIRIT